ncbi:non-hydrolyzing UDP-N-acetylglucosamine 2-epimerase [Candidatus Nitrosotenuis uzonensis]|uniref:UDP-n-acetylglucosamine 2-epimerase n=1 Tax=Candidatus Nitrosotenuis uzonensis TaxID=1407055 RepID=V6AV50_9ARCH|nr:UDP-N-acetylglucosamine 2-epimerase (non-hydrolyzing) [Candidatus Nitrosotenuis uzonensis]CDI06465.1 UDP-n-acetylglucosamine 2-epimerase [Candidatus Nitrosotenuis uzonensis]
MKVCLIVGTRPQIIKSQPIVQELKRRKANIFIIHTGQHYDYEMSRVFFEDLDIKKPHLNLGIKKGTSAQQLTEIISKLEKPLLKIKPDFVIVPGDTRSALGASLCANRCDMKLVHVEAGARSGDFELEEEVNRRIIDTCSNYLFAPTKNCFKNLKGESVLGVPYLTGDTMYDVFLLFKEKLKIKIKKEDHVLMTIHRKNNIEDPMKFKKIIELANKISNLGYTVTFPVHPHTKKQLKKFGISLKNITEIEPLKYSAMLAMLAKSKLLLTDSGGLQKEAYWLNTPCMTLRKSTEWIETIRQNTNVLVSEIKPNTLQIAKKMLSRKIKSAKNNEFGNGRAAQKMTSILFDNL